MLSHRFFFLPITSVTWSFSSVSFGNLFLITLWIKLIYQPCWRIIIFITLIYKPAFGSSCNPADTILHCLPFINWSFPNYISSNFCVFLFAKPFYMKYFLCTYLFVQIIKSCGILNISMSGFCSQKNLTWTSISCSITSSFPAHRIYVSITMISVLHIKTYNLSRFF